jgi:type II secretory pathway pseudopilin PulG
MELVTVLIIVGILSVVIAPRFWGSTFDEAKFFDEATTALRYAQRSATAMQRTVCVGFAGNTITLTYDTVYGSSACGTPLGGPSGAASYVVTAQGGGGFAAAPASFNFDRVGRPSNPQTLSLLGGFQIVVENETGFVH